MKRNKLKVRKQFYIYAHCRPDGEPFYVGYSGNPQRCYEFTARRRNQYYVRVVAKYGKENILIYTRNCVSEQQAHEHEIWMIAWCRVQGFRLTNLTDGGEGASGWKHTTEAKEKNRQAHLGKQNSLGYKHTKEAIAKIKEKASRSREPCSEVTKEKIRQANIGKPSGMLGKKHTKKTIAKMKERARNRSPMSEGTKEKIRQTLKGNIPWNKGKKGLQTAWNKGLKFADTKED
jgi:hypothetical protein